MKNSMNAPLVIEYLKSHSLNDLKREHGVNHRFSNDAKRVSLNYDQFEAKKGDLLSEQCRGMVLGVDWRDAPVGVEFGDINFKHVYHKLLAWPMNRFHNQGEFHCANVNFNDPNLKFYDKRDGTLCIVYFDDSSHGTGAWRIATRSVPDADLPFTDAITQLKENTFSELFKYALRRTMIEHRDVDVEFDEWSSIYLDKGVTYCYELTSPLNRIVVKYDSYAITLLAMRNIKTGEELHVDDDCSSSSFIDRLKSRRHGYRSKVCEFKNMNELTTYITKSDPVKIEGCVICDSNFNRVKVKSEQWVLASRSKNGAMTSERHAMRCIIDETIDGILPLLDDVVVEKLYNMRRALEAFYETTDKNRAKWNELVVDLPDKRKQFALLVKKSKLWQPPYFETYDKHWLPTKIWLKNQLNNGKITTSMIDTILQEIKLNTLR